jgi:hypothetical protein
MNNSRYNHPLTSNPQFPITLDNISKVFVIPQLALYREVYSLPLLPVLPVPSLILLQEQETLQNSEEKH